MMTDLMQAVSYLRQRPDVDSTRIGATGSRWARLCCRWRALWRPALRLVGPLNVLFALNALRGPSLVYNGETDEVVAIPEHGEEFFGDRRARTIQLLGSDKNVFDYAFAPDGAAAAPQRRANR